MYYRTGGEFVILSHEEARGESWSCGSSLIIFAQDVGVWSTAPLSKSLHITGSINTVFWASGNGMINFEIRVLVNGESVGLTLTSGSLPLSRNRERYLGGTKIPKPFDFPNPGLGIRKGQDKDGEEYTILIEVLDNSGNTYSSNASEPFKLKMGQGGGSSGTVPIGLVPIIILAAVLIVFRRRSLKLNIFKSK